MAADAAAKELIEFAKNRLNKFYNPKLYKPPPESFDAYPKKSEESNGISAMMDALIKDLNMEMTEAEVRPTCGLKAVDLNGLLEKSKFNVVALSGIKLMGVK